MKIEAIIGQHVRFTREFLRNTGQTIGNMPFCYGKVTEVVPLGHPDRYVVHFETPWGVEMRALNTNLETTPRGWFMARQMEEGKL